MRRTAFQLERLELSSELCARLLPAGEKSAVSSFTQDVLVRLRTKPTRLA